MVIFFSVSARERRESAGKRSGKMETTRVGGGASRDLQLRYSRVCEIRGATKKKTHTQKRIRASYRLIKRATGREGEFGRALECSKSRGEDERRLRGITKPEERRWEKEKKKKNRKKKESWRKRGKKATRRNKKARTGGGEADKGKKNGRKRSRSGRALEKNFVAVVETIISYGRTSRILAR